MSEGVGDDEGIDELLKELLPDGPTPGTAGVPGEHYAEQIGYSTTHGVDSEPSQAPGDAATIGSRPVRSIVEPAGQAAQPARAPVPVATDLGRSSSRMARWPLALLGVAVVAGGAFWLGTRLADDGTSTGTVDSAVALSEGSDDGSAADADADQDPASPSPSSTAIADGSGTEEDEGAVNDEAGEVANSEAVDFEIAGTDEQGRPLPALPDELVLNTENAASLPGYYPDPPSAPETGPYTVIQGGRYYLRGTVSSENLRQEVIRRGLLVIPRELMVIEYEIDESDPWYLDDPYLVLLEDDVLFAPGSDEVDPQILPVVEAGANLLLLDPRIAIRVTGHTDDQGAEDFNLDLSQSRADSVRDEYLAFGVAEHQVIAVGRGESEPVASNDTEEGREANRRVEFEVLLLEE